MNSLERLRQKTMLAIRYSGLVKIAFYAISPSTAYKAAKKLDWGEDLAVSCRYLSILFREYGYNVAFNQVRRNYPQNSVAVCFCSCHLKKYDLKFLVDYEPVNICYCCDSECLHASHQLREVENDCPFCNEEPDCDDNEEPDCDDCTGLPCSHCDNSSCSGCDENDCENCEIIYDTELCENCKCNNCANRINNQEDSEQNEIPDEINWDNLSKGEIAREVFSKVQSAAGINCEMIIVKNDLQKQAKTDGSNVCLTTALIEKLDKDELAFVIGHEISHIKNDHCGLVLKGDKILKEGLADTFSNSKGVFKKVLKTAVNGVVGFAMLKKGRKIMEFNADEEGNKLAEKAGFDPRGQSVLQKLDPGLSRGGKIFDSHPRTFNRFDNLNRKE